MRSSIKTYKVVVQPTTVLQTQYRLFSYHIQRFFRCQKNVYTITLMWKLIGIPFRLNRFHSGQFSTFKLIAAAAITYENTLICSNF